MKGRVAIFVLLGVVALLAVPAGAWLLQRQDREARALRFANDGSDLQATDVQSALQELSQRVKLVEKGGAALQGAAMAQQAQIGALQVRVEEQKAASETRLAAVEGRVAEPPPPRRRLEYSDGSSSNTVGASYHRLREVGGFSKVSATSPLLLSWNTHVDALGEPGTFCDFQLRVDGRPDHDRDGGGGRAVVYVPPNSTGGSAPVTVSALFQRPGAGSHTVGVWVRGTSRECLENYGNFPRTVLVEEGPASPAR
jgi:hypothetical protein